MQQNNQKIFPFQKRFIEKLLSYSLIHDHVLYCIDNETSGDAAWSFFWSEFITDKAAESGKKICVTEMWDPWELHLPLHQNTFDHPERFQFCDISQNTHNNGEKLRNNLAWVYNYIEKHPRPLNVVKTYGVDGGRFGNDKNGIERWWLHLLGGTASARFHRPPSGLGLSELSASSVRAARLLERTVKFRELKVDNIIVKDNHKNKAFAAANDKYCVVFISGGGKIQLNNSGFRKIKYLNLGNGKWYKTEKLKNNMSDIIDIETPDNNQWVILIGK